MVIIGIDLGSLEGDYSACRCPRCREPHKWRGPSPKQCKRCGRRFNFAGLQVVAPQQTSEKGEG